MTATQYGPASFWGSWRMLKRAVAAALAVVIGTPQLASTSAPAALTRAPRMSTVAPDGSVHTTRYTPFAGSYATRVVIGCRR